MKIALFGKRSFRLYRVVGILYFGKKKHFLEAKPNTDLYIISIVVAHYISFYHLTSAM